jgi:hypothetical protein
MQLPTFDDIYQQAEALIVEAQFRQGKLSANEAEWIDEFFRNARARMLNLYDLARLGSSRISERKQMSLYWREQAEYFLGQLGLMQRLESKRMATGVPEQPTLKEAIQIINKIVEACRDVYQLHT